MGRRRPFGQSSDAAWPPVPRLWAGETAVLVGAGPSVSEEQVAYCRGRARVLVVNCSYRLAPWADLLYACDWGWWNKYRPEFGGVKVSQDVHALEIQGVKRVPSERKPGLSLDPLRIHQGANSGYQALNLAVLLGATRLLLLGYDMRAAAGRRHWHGDHPEGLNNPTGELFAAWIAAYRTTKKDLLAAAVEVINCTPDSALDCFPRASLEAVL